jgi:hypothetical protein
MSPAAGAAASAPAFAAPSEGWQASAARYELKYVGPAAAAGALEALLRAHCPPEGAHAENVVHSVYFDTARLAAYGEKADGEYVKTKLRLRWYEPHAGFAWLEIKAKRGSLGAKQRKRIPFAPPGPDADAEVFARIAREHLGVALQPSVWLAYRRLRRATPDARARVALDRDIRVVWAGPALARRERPGPLPVFVLEQKGDALEPSPWLAGLIGRFARRAAFSKYTACVDAVRGGRA